MNLIHAYHAPATFAFEDRPLTVQLTLPDEESEILSLYLEYTVSGADTREGRVRLLPVDGILAEESYAVYAATLPAHVLAGANGLSYCFERDGIRSEDYAV